MKNEFLKEAIFDVEITLGDIKVEKKNISYDQAVSIVGDLAKRFPDHDQFQNTLKQGGPDSNSFGMISSGGKDFNYHVSAYAKTVHLTEEKQTCPRREDGHTLQDYWILRGDDKCCSYCGSAYPERVLELI